MFTKEEKQLIRQFLNENEGTVFIGADSQKYSTNSASFAVVLIVHIDNSKGCKLFGYTEKEQDFDKSLDKPRMRLMMEVQKVVDVYTEFEEELIDREVEIHLDINPDPVHNSNIVFKQAIGYVRGVTGLEPVVKPDAWAATHGGDHMVRGKLRS